MRHEFVAFVPEKLDADTIYVALEHDVAVHLCACGCGNEVVTPLSPAEWSLTYNGKDISLYPSIGNWSFPCKSHYWIKAGRIDWASTFSTEQIEAVRARDAVDKLSLFDPQPEQAIMAVLPARQEEKNRPFGWLINLFRKR